MADKVRRRSCGGVLPLGLHTSISGPSIVHCASVSIEPLHQEEQNARSSKRFKSEQAVARARDAAEQARLFDELESDWVLLDAEIMPWSAKAQALIVSQYAPTAAAARVGLAAAQRAVRQAIEDGRDLVTFEQALAGRLARAEALAAVTRRYAWPVETIDDLKIAPFHLLASEGCVHSDKPHAWHMSQLARLADVDPLFKATQVVAVDLESEGEIERAVAWWLELTASGGEGMVVKPADFLARGRRGVTQPAIKCRGREYLRLIYGPDYDLPAHLARLRERGLGAKRSLAFREFALGL